LPRSPCWIARRGSEGDGGPADEEELEEVEDGRPASLRLLVAAPAEDEEPGGDDACGGERDLRQAQPEEHPVAEAEWRETGPRQSRRDHQQGEEQAPEEDPPPQPGAADEEHPAVRRQMEDGQGVDAPRSEVEARSTEEEGDAARLPPR